MQLTKQIDSGFPKQPFVRVFLLRNFNRGEESSTRRRRRRCFDDRVGERFQAPGRSCCRRLGIRRSYQRRESRRRKTAWRTMRKSIVAQMEGGRCRQRVLEHDDGEFDDDCDQIERCKIDNGGRVDERSIIMSEAVYSLTIDM